MRKNRCGFPTVLSYLLAAAGICLPIIGNAEDKVSYQLINGRIVAPLDKFRECDRCPEMIALPTGSFMMGATPEDSRNPFDWYGENATGRVREPGEINIIPSEHPRHQVEIDIPFAIGVNEVKHAEWMACVADSACTHDPDHRALTLSGYVSLGPNHPAIDVSYFDILEYVSWLNSVVGSDVYRIPTEAEWEFAARAGTETRFAQGDDLSADQANVSRSATERVRRTTMPDLVDRDMPVRVNELDAANGWGLRHMSGNVSEWTQSCYTEQHLGLLSTSEYLALVQTQTTCDRVAKGGAYSTAVDTTRPAGRLRPTETRRRSDLGFRLIREFN